MDEELTPYNYMKTKTSLIGSSFARLARSSRCWCAITASMLVLSAERGSAAVVVSTLDLTTIGPAAIGIGNWPGFAFTTGDSAYTLNSITAKLNISSFDSENGLELLPTLILADENNLPTGEPITVSFSNPASQGAGYHDYVFETTATVTLAANTTYVFTLGSDNSSNIAGWALADFGDSVSGTWDMPVVLAHSGDAGASWTDFGGGTYRLMAAVNAEAVPEPMSAAMAAMGALALLRRRRA